MKGVTEIGHRYGGCFLGANGMVVFFAVYGSMNSAGVVANMFHNIYFPIIGPLQGLMASQHPDSRPGAQSFG